MQNSALDKLLDLDIPDPSDFPPEAIAPGLRHLDEALRCSICGDLFKAPVTVSCGHCFCSLCIREHLLEKTECPICRKQTTEFHVRRNMIMESAIKAWEIARPTILRLYREDERRRTQPQSNTPPQADGKHNSPSSPKKRKWSPESDDEVQFIGTHVQPHKLDDQGVKRKAKKQGTFPPDSSASLSGHVVDCPACLRKVLFDNMDDHLDSNCTSCLFDLEITNSKGKQKSEWQKVFNGDAGGSSNKTKGKQRAKVDTDDLEPLPKASYHLLKEKRLREMLSEQELPTTGDKDTLSTRHQRWIMIYNANLDFSPAKRRSLDKLRRDLKKWETERQGKKQVVTDVDAYQRANKSNFDQLIAAARPKKAGSTQRSRSSAKMSDQDVLVVESEGE